MRDLEAVALEIVGDGCLCEGMPGDDNGPCYGCERRGAILHALEAERRATREAITLVNLTWPLSDVLRILADAVDHLEDAHDCDGHGWENRRRARDVARKTITAIRALATEGT